MTRFALQSRQLKACYKIGVSAFQDLHETILDAYYKNYQVRLWKGYCVFGGDGSTLSLPRRGDTDAMLTKISEKGEHALSWSERRRLRKILEKK